MNRATPSKRIPAESSQQATARSRLALVALIAGASAIAFAPLFVRLSELGPSATAFYRLFLALPIMALWRWTEREMKGPATATDYLDLAAAGLFFAGDLAVWHWSIKLTSVANATLFANAAPIFVGLVAWRFLRQRFTTTFLFGMFLALLGAATLMWDTAHQRPAHLLGDTLGIITALFYAAYLLWVARLRARFSTAAIMAWSGVAASFALLIIAWLSGENMIAMSGRAWLVLIGLALISQVTGQSLIAFALAHLPPTFGAVSLLWQPVAAAGLAWLLLGEALGTRQLVGAAIVLIGIYLAQRGRDAASSS